MLATGKRNAPQIEDRTSGIYSRVYIAVECCQPDLVNSAMKFVLAGIVWIRFGEVNDNYQRVT